MLTSLLYAAGVILLFLAVLELLGVFTVGTADWVSLAVAGVIALIAGYFLASAPRGRL